MNSTALAVFAYRRPSHLLRVLRSLQVQLQQISLPVHLFLDGPRGDDDVCAVQACRNVAEKFTTDIDIHLNQSSVNRGLYLSITEGVSLILGQYSQIIVLEEDILTSPYFLRYMLDGLNRYADEPRVASIHGYVPPIPAELSDTFFLRGADCWGWATWRDRWSLYRHDAAAMASEIRSCGLARAFDLGGHVPNLRLLDARAAGRSSSWAICWHASCFLAERFTLHPGRSLVRNIGLDYSGEHCAPSASLEAVLTDRPLAVSLQKVEENPAIVASFARQLAPAPLPLRVLKRLYSAFLRRPAQRLVP